ncbi:MAG: hypothetical protein AAGK57_07610, partial [Pseudomonadota bacterium]
PTGTRDRMWAQWAGATAAERGGSLDVRASTWSDQAVAQDGPSPETGFLGARHADLVTHWDAWEGAAAQQDRARGSGSRATTPWSPPRNGDVGPMTTAGLPRPFAAYDGAEPGLKQCLPELTHAKRRHLAAGISVHPADSDLWAMGVADLPWMTGAAMLGGDGVMRPIGGTDA